MVVIPVRSPAWRVNLLNALFSSVASGCLQHTVLRLAQLSVCLSVSHMILPNSVDQLAKFHGLLPWENCRILLPPVYELIEKFLCDKAGHARARTHTHTHTSIGTTRWAGTRKVKPIWILLKQETVSGSGISWAICNSALSSRQITTPAHHRSVFYRLDALPAAQPTVSKHWRHKAGHTSSYLNSLNIKWWVIFGMWLMFDEWWWMRTAVSQFI